MLPPEESLKDAPDLADITLLDHLILNRNAEYATIDLYFTYEIMCILK
jgi:hypothetical protein